MVRILILILCFLCSCSIDTERDPRTLIVFNFDDGHESIYTNSFRIMQEFDSSWSATNFISIEAINRKKHLTLDMLRHLEKAGWSTGGHGVTHENLSSVDIVKAEEEIKGSLDSLQKYNLSHSSFAYPSGNYNEAVQKITEKYFTNIRTGSDIPYIHTVNSKNLGYFAVMEDHSLEIVINRIEYALLHDSPIVVIGFHGVIEEDEKMLEGSYYCSADLFRGVCQYIQENNLSVYSFEKALPLLARD